MGRVVVARSIDHPRRCVPVARGPQPAPGFGRGG
jgi:hypothetical protein